MAKVDKKSDKKAEKKVKAAPKVDKTPAKKVPISSAEILAKAVCRYSSIGSLSFLMVLHNREPRSRQKKLSALTLKRNQSRHRELSPRPTVKLLLRPMAKYVSCTIYVFLCANAEKLYRKQRKQPKVPQTLRTRLKMKMRNQRLLL
jgi:hypothetical protein